MRFFAILLLLFTHNAFAATFGTVNVQSKLNCRSIPSTSGYSLKALSNGTQVEILGESGDWLKVKCVGNVVGFVAKAYVRRTEGSASLSPRGRPTPADAGVPSGCASPARATNVTHYLVPILPSFNDRRCRRIEGTCIYQKNGVDMLYNVGIGEEPVSRSRCPHGYGSRGNCLEPCKSVAADTRFHPLGKILYFPRLKGMRCKGKVHDGFVRVDDVGGAIDGANRFDFFWGECLQAEGDSCKDGSPTFGYAESISAALSRSTYYSCGRQNTLQRTPPGYPTPPGAR